MSKIIVSYRRSDSTAIAGRIFDRLVDRYGEASVFMDIDKIPFGTDFRHHIMEVLRGADVLLAVVGPNWLGKTPDGRTRIQDEADPVRVEVEAALKQKMAVIPILVGDAVMPGAADLPDSLRDFAYINAAPVDEGRDFRQHMERLLRSVDTIVAGAAPVASKATPAGGRLRTVAAVATAVVLLLAGVLVLAPDLIFTKSPQPTKEPPDRPPAKQFVGKPPAPVPEPTTTGKPAPQPAVTAKPGTTTTPATDATPTPAPTAPTYRVLASVSGGVQNLRSGPAVRYRIVAAIPAGATGIELGTCRPAEDNTLPWCAAKWQNHSGWISSCCVVDEKTGAPPRIN